MKAGNLIFPQLLVFFARFEALLAACFHVGFLLGLFFNPEDGGNMFLQNVGLLSTNYTALYPRRWKSPKPPL
jgi:hypothetical protein